MDPSTQPEKTAPDDDVNALETPEEELNPAATDAVTEAEDASKETAKTKKKSFKQIIGRFNVYLLLFGFILLLAGGIVLVAYFQSKKATTSTIQSQSLTQSTLKQLASTDVSVGDAKQVLNVQSSAVFAGKVLIRDSLEVAGNLQLGGTLALANITVSNTGTFSTLQASKGLSVAGDTAIQGQASIGNGLQVKGNGSFSGNVTASLISASAVQLNGDLTLTHHIIAGGPLPAHSTGPAVGGGGTTSLSGSDSSGSITVSTGSAPTAGCFINITFATKYPATPHVTITPIGADAAILDYYVNRSVTGFSVCDATAADSGKNFGFDYFITD